MNEKLCDKLSELNVLAKKQGALKSDMDLSKQEYISKRVTKPQTKYEKRIIQPTIESSKVLFPMILFTVGAILGIVLLISMGYEGMGALFGVGGFVCAVLSFIFIKGFVCAKKSEKVSLKLYAEELREVEAVRTFNEVEYPKLLEKYNNDCEKLGEEFIGFKEKTSAELKDVNEKIAALDIEYPPQGYYLLDRVISALSERRADDLGAAIRLAKREYDEQRAIDEEAMRELESYSDRLSNIQAEWDREREERNKQREEERAAEFKRKYEADKANAARKQANAARCAKCANFLKCTYSVQWNTDNCAAYRPK